MRRFILFLFVFLGVLFLIFALVFFFKEQESEPKSEPRTESGDTFPPSTAIRSPDERSWHSTGFPATILDSDLGSGLAEGQGCSYRIYDLGEGRVFEGSRPCGQTQVFVSVGEGKACSSSFTASSNAGLCQLKSKARDKTGNESSFKSRLFFIDFTRPSVGKAIIPDIIQPGEELFIETSVSDNGKITGCGFFVQGKEVAATPTLSPLPCEKDELCSISLSHAFVDPGEYTASFSCSDAAGNIGVGEAVPFRVFENQAPEVLSCRVIPTKGIIDTQFRFELEARDPDNDPLSFLWDFGDDITSKEQSSLHSYTQQGTFRPQVAVQDPSGETALCSTAWVIVE